MGIGVEDEWKVVCVSKGKDARREAFKWMCDANVQVMAMIKEDMRRASAHRPSARGADQGHG
jgi:hypothetical protein